jgi:preprotein translocase subunit SecA
MRTGEGKTLTIAAPCIAASLEGHPVHVVTVNEYLAQRDAETLRPLYEAFGLSVGVLKAGQSPAAKKAAYACDIVYGVNYEFGFDYLRDNMVLSSAARVQRGLGFVVVDEVDSILIDEARTPLIISGLAPAEEGLELLIDGVVRQLRRGIDYLVDEKDRTAAPTDAGYSMLESLLAAEGVIPSRDALYSSENLFVLQQVAQALLAHSLYRRDKQYVVQDGYVVIIDESTGRAMPGRRWGEGLHESIEAKEGLTIQPRTQTQATVTYQNFFGLYVKLAGLTGTASTEAEEFVEIYGLETVVVPPNRPVVRIDSPDVVFRTIADKDAGVVAEVAIRHAAGQPVLIGTGSVADSERISGLLLKAGLPHSLLNARQNAQEADVVSLAGLPGAITVATNMAGRGTDILLGGKPGEGEASVREAVLSVGGLHVIGTERHESRRVDNQLRGRAGRQGDAGSSQFFISLEDKLLRVFAAERQGSLVKLVSAGEGVSSPLLDKVVTLAQKRMEQQGFQSRLDLMKYDKVLASQRDGLYAVRNEFVDEGLSGLRAQALSLAGDASEAVCAEWLPVEEGEPNFDAVGFKEALGQLFGITLPVVAWYYQDDLEPAAIRRKVREAVQGQVGTWCDSAPEASIRAALLTTLDQQWMAHLTRLDELRESVGLRAMAQQSPVVAFSLEAKRLFQALKAGWAFEAVQQLKELALFVAAADGDVKAAGGLKGGQKVQLALFQRHVSRNESCPCGSEMRFKFCHGMLVRKAA